MTRAGCGSPASSRPMPKINIETEQPVAGTSKSSGLPQTKNKKHRERYFPKPTSETTIDWTRVASRPLPFTHLNTGGVSAPSRASTGQDRACRRDATMRAGEDGAT